IAFDPESRRISGVDSIGGYRPITFCLRSNGRFLVALVGAGDLSDALGTLDDRGMLSQVTPIHGKWSVNYPRGMIEIGDGQVWVGGTGGLTRFTGRQVQHFVQIE